MQETEKIQKAVKMAVAAGYQLNKEAFDLLNLLSSTEDPANIMERAIQKIATLREKPFFIDRKFIEEMLEEDESRKETTTNAEQELIATETETSFQELTSEVTEAKREFHPYAKEVQSDLKIIDDASSSLTSNGTINDYLGYFRDRFIRMEKLLRQRIDVRSATFVIDALKAQPNARLKIIVMITEKREAKQKIILNVEDLEANITASFPKMPLRI